MFRWQLILAWICLCLYNVSYGKMKRGQYNHYKGFCIPDEMYSGLPWDCTGYLQCKQTSHNLEVFWFECPQGLYYSMRDRTCTWPQSTERNCPRVEEIIEQYCQINPTALIPNPENCAQYYDCSNPTSLSKSVRFMKECKYPYLFSTDTMKCDDFNRVECDARMIPVSPCDYVAYSQCTGPECPSCTESIPGCLRSPDGRNSYPERPLTKYFVECLNGKTIKVDTCADGVFDPIKRACTNDLDPKAIEEYCRANPNHKIPHPGNCAHYFDCQKQTSRANYEKYEMECMYPKLFSSLQRTCLPFAQVKCGSRYEPKAPCEYVADKCFGANCPPCEEQNPSCISLPDGKNPYFGRENTPHYIVCEQERTKEITRCKNGNIFDPARKECVLGTTRPLPPFPGGGTLPVPPFPGGGSGTGGGSGSGTGGVIGGGGTGSGIGGGSGTGTGTRPVIPPFPPNLPGGGGSGTLDAECRRNPMELRVDPDNCARYFNCSKRDITPGFKRYQDECAYPQLFSATTKSCMDFPSVDCGTRYEPKAPCNYENTRRLCTGAMCKLSCEERSPSCEGQPNGNNTFPQRELTPFYMTCLRERTLSVGVCRYGIYDPTLRYCTTDLDEFSVKSYCAKNPSKVFPHVANCARYYNCSATDVHPVFGMHQRECTAPYLFHIDLLRCAPAREVECRWRFEPKDPCNYLANQYCSVANCAPCSDRFPSCAGLTDGRHSVPASEMDYVVCRGGLFVEKGSCAPNVFDPLTKKCKSSPTSLCTGLADGNHVHSQKPTDYIVCLNGQLIKIESCAPYSFSSQLGICSTEYSCYGFADGTYPVPQSQTDYFQCRGGQFVQRASCAPNNYDHSSRACAMPASQCAGLTNGRHPIQDNDYQYMVCVNNALLRTETCSPFIFDSASRSCGNLRSCSGLSDGTYPIPQSTTDYYECRGGKYIQKASCAPNNYDHASKSCAVPTQPIQPQYSCAGLADGSYPIPQSTTDYYVCGGGQFLHKASCAPNNYDQASRSCSVPTQPIQPINICAGLTNGRHPVQDSDSRYMVCLNNVLLRNETCSPFIFDPNTKSCGQIRSCEGLADGYYGVPSSNTDFYTCLRNRFMGIQSCAPMLFDSNTKQCKAADINVCRDKQDGNYPEPLKDTDYYVCRNGVLDKTLSCAPNKFDVVLKTCADTCSGLADGNYLTESDYKYAVCSSGVTLSTQSCFPFMFDTELKVCNNLRSCSMLEDGRYAIAGSTNKYYVCLGRKFMGIKNCGQSSYDPVKKECENAKMCAGLKDGNHPYPGKNMDYIVCQGGVMTNMLSCAPKMFDAATGKCIRVPNLCIGLSNGRHEIEGKDTDYVICQDNNLVKTESCSPYIYDTTKKQCSTSIKSCQGEPDGKYPVPLSNSDYYECLGHHYMGIKSCLPDIFDTTTKVCRAAQEDKCAGLSDGKYKVPNSDSDYIICKGSVVKTVGSCAPGTFDQTSGKCINKPTCVGKPDGNHPVVGSGTDYYICKNRILTATKSCAPNLYDVNTKTCRVSSECIGQADGNHPLKGENDRYVVCMNGAMVRVESCAPYIFDTDLRVCATGVSCVGLQNGNHPYPGRLMNYIICKNGELIDTVSCAPDVYDSNTRRCLFQPTCRDFPDGNHSHPRNPMEFLVCRNGNLVTTKACSFGFDPVKRDCRSAPSCSAEPDGNHLLPGTDNYYYICSKGLLLDIAYCQGTIFNDVGRVCSTIPSCFGLADAFYPIPGRPNMYIRCVHGAAKEVKTCGKQVFDPIGQKCSTPSCSGLADGKHSLMGSAYDYFVCLSNNLVEIKSCSPNLFHPITKKCRKSPTCAGLPEGKYALFDSRTDYIVCRGGSILEVGTCSPRQFDRELRICIDSGPSCLGLPDGINPHPSNTNNYIVCKNSVLQRTESCGSAVYNRILKRCGRGPSCRDLPDGNNPDIDNKSNYLMCSYGVLVGYVSCAPDVYNPITRLCSKTLNASDPDTFCSQNPTAIIPHPDSCAQYINCGNKNTELGNYREECLYMQLFSTYTNSCRPYREVKCGIRPEPRAPCEYEKMNLCPSGNCPQCATENPSCVGKRDGIQAFPSRLNYYIKCQDERTVDISKCPATSPLFDAVTGKCTFVLDPLNPAPYCEANPNEVIAHPDNCGQYIDCRFRNTALGGYRNECNYPDLWDTTTLSCRNFNDVNCGTRKVPKSPCDYEQNMPCMDPDNCIPCNERMPSCIGLPDGKHAFPNRPDSYITCYRERTNKMEKCPSGIYDATLRSCIEVFNPQKPDAYCSKRPFDKIANELNCATYFDCSKPRSVYGPYLQECEYPLLYDRNAKSCRAFSVVRCGKRFEPMEPCEYLQNQQCLNLKPGEVCKPCHERLPSCIGRPEGNNTFPGQENTKYFITCFRNRTVFVRECNNGYFDPQQKKCVSSSTPTNPVAFCRASGVGRFPHPTNCHQYYDCTQENSPLGPYLLECDYPMGYNILSKNCEFFLSLQCGNRILPQKPCDYMQNQCAYRPNDLNCKRCEDRLPSCVGLPDGNNTFPGQELTPRYVTCMSNRTIKVNQCERGFFNPRRLACMNRLRPGVVRDYCNRNPGVIVANPMNCAQYFDCGEESIRARTYLRECPYPMYFDKTISVCRNFTLVDCDYRPKIVAPCDYLQNKCNPLDRNCVPCEKRMPSCVGLPDGNNGYPYRPMSSEYFQCYQGRTIGIEKCLDKGFFDKQSRKCVGLNDINEDMVKNYCRVNVEAIFAHPRNCAQYYDCRQMIGGSYLRECRYPQLFDERGICRNFSEVNCGERTEPEAPCEYLQNRCPPNVKDCAPCEQRLPRCIGLPDGNNAFPGRPFSEYYIKCFRNRTVSVEACQVSLYDQTLRTCSPTIDQGLMDKYCRENPTGVVPDPLNCARYYNCSDPSVKPGIGTKYLNECKYPRLWNSSYLTTSPTSGCVLFTDVQCNGRVEPKAPCEYVENQCVNGTCPITCEEQYPSCKGKQDGSNIFPGKEGSEFYTVCYKERTVAIVTCTIGVYSHNDRSCVGDSRPASTTP